MKRAIENKKRTKTEKRGPTTLSESLETETENSVTNKENSSEDRELENSKPKNYAES